MGFASCSYCFGCSVRLHRPPSDPTPAIPQVNCPPTSPLYVVQDNDCEQSVTSPDSVSFNDSKSMRLHTSSVSAHPLSPPLQGDDSERFMFFSRAALEFMVVTGREPDVLHLHDWQSSTVVSGVGPGRHGSKPSFCLILVSTDTLALTLRPWFN